MGRVKLKIKKLQNMNARQATYAKRKHGIMKKAMELSILCDIDIALLMFSPAGKPSLCSGKHSIGEVIAKFAQLTPQERSKRKLENLEALKKTFVKLNHDINISEFLDRSKPSFEDLSDKVMFLKTHLSYIHRRLSYWAEIEKSDSVDQLQRVETSLRYTLAKIRTHKENMRQQLEQQQLVSSECKNQLQTEIDIDFGMDMEQELENFSWVRNDENMNVPVQEEDQSLQLHHMYKDVACSASSSIGCYSGLFGTNSSDISTQNLETGGIPRKLADPSQQFSNHSFLNDPKLQQLAEWNLLGSPADFYVSQILEASYKPQVGGNNWSSSETLPYPVAVFDDPLFSQPN